MEGRKYQVVVDCAIGARLEARRLSLEFRFGYWMGGFKLVELMVDTNGELWVGSSCSYCRRKRK